MVKGYRLYPTEEELCRELERIGCDKEGVSIMVPRGIFHLVKLTQVPLRAALILKQEMLSKGGEAALPWQASALMVDTCDLLLMGTERIFKELLRVLPFQPFGLRDIKEILESLFRAMMTERIETNRGPLSLKEPQLMGILNITPDSFYDGGEYDSLERAVRRAVQLEEEGAHIIDIGGESTRPGSKALSTEEELERVLPILERVLEETSLPISVDTYKEGVAREVLKSGASIINDIYGLHYHEDVASVVAEYQAPVIIMHMKGEPGTMQKDPRYKNLLQEILAYLEEGIEKALLAGLPKDKIIIDPGIGFGKRVDHNLQILKDLKTFLSPGYPLLVGPSNKSFIGQVLDLPLEERLEGTAAAIALSIQQGAHMIRVHDVKSMKRVVRMAHAITRGLY